MNMGQNIPKLKIFYVASLVTLGVITAFMFLFLTPSSTGAKYSEVTRIEFLRGEDECVLELDILNHEGRDQSYVVNMLFGDKQYSERIMIPDGEIYTYTCNIYPDRMIDEKFVCSICKEGGTTPIEEVTYYLPQMPRVETVPPGQPEFREYARKKYPNELDEDLITMIEDLIEDTTQERIPKWESELWDYLSSGDGVRCPTYSRCQNRLSGGWCPSDNLDYIAQLLDDRQFDVSKYDSMGSMGECGRIFQLVERLAQKYLQRAEVHCPPLPAEIISLADEQHPIEVRLVPLKSYHGAIWYLKGNWIIQLNGNDTPDRRRFSLFHEAFHILAHLRATPVFKKTECREGSFNELLADYFAGSILMPGEWVREKWTEVKDLGGMTKIFDVPRSLMWIRLRETGLIQIQ